MSHDPGFDASIPVLTEVVADQVKPDEAPPLPAPGIPAAAVFAASEPEPEPVPEPVPESAPALVAAAAPEPDESPERLERRAIERWSGEQWGVMERRVTNRILQQLQGRVDFVLEQRLREGIAEAVDRVMADMADEIRIGLQATLGEVVSRAVTQEIAHLQTLGK